MAAASCTAVLVVRDEAAHVGDCLRSVCDLVDEVVVLDTGSSDATRDIARDTGARVLESAWRGDFAAARNEALSHARGAWILSIDADERVTPPLPAGIGNCCRNPDAVAFRVWLRPGPGFTPSRHWRLFRNDPRIRFEGRIRESVAPSIRRLEMAAGRPLTGDCDITIDHQDDPDVRHRKHARDLPLLEAAVAEDASNVVYWTDLGRALDAVGRADDAVAAWERAVGLVRARGARTASDGLPFTEILQRLGRDDARRQSLLDEACARFPDDPLIDWIRAQTLIARRSFGEALPILVRLADRDVDGGAFPELSYDRRLFAEFAYAAIATCYAGLGRWHDAAVWFERASRSAPAVVEYRTKHAVAAARCGRPRTAARN